MVKQRRVRPRAGDARVVAGAWASRASREGWALVSGGMLAMANPAFLALNRSRQRDLVWRCHADDVRVEDEPSSYPTLRELVIAEVERLGAGPRTKRCQRRFVRGDQVIELTFERRTHGRRTAVLVNVLDLTDRLEMEAALRASQEMLVQQQRLVSIGELAFGIAHDINNMLAALRLRMGLLLRDAHCTRRQGNNLEVASRILDDAAALVSKLQNMGRVEPPKITAVDIVETVHAAVDIAQSGLSARSPLSSPARPLRIVCELGDMPKVRGYANELRHVFVNLLLNARDAMPHGGMIRIRGRRSERWVVITVEDEGIGIPRQDLDRIFEPLFTTKGTRGTGMGLAMAKNVLVRLGSTITARNRPRGGACFELRFVPFDTRSSGGAPGEGRPRQELATRRLGVPLFHSPPGREFRA